MCYKHIYEEYRSCAISVLRTLGLTFNAIIDLNLIGLYVIMYSMTQYWLMKSEPDVYSIDDLKREGKTHWEGIRNYQARILCVIA